MRTLMLLFDIRIHVPGSYTSKKFHIFVGVELGHLPFSCRFSPLVSAIRDNSSNELVLDAHEYLHPLV